MGAYRRALRWCFARSDSADDFEVRCQATDSLSQSNSRAALAKLVDEAAAGLGVPREEHAFSPHLTLARGGARRGSGAPHRLKGDGPNPVLQRLQEKLAAMRPPEFATMTAREFFLYQSQPMQGGARYTKIARFGLE